VASLFSVWNNKELLYCSLCDRYFKPALVNISSGEEECLTDYLADGSMQK
jgi:hypothetical protein